jgi:hypothetical protein
MWAQIAIVRRRGLVYAVRWDRKEEVKTPRLESKKGQSWVGG